MATKKNQPALQITPPFGYGEIAPLQKTDRVLLPAAGATPNFCRAINALALSYSEFNAAAHDYPIVFATADKGESYSPVIVLGLSDDRNLFVDDAGEWDKAAYLPAFVRRYPFCISKLYVDGEARSEKVVCVVKAYLDKQGLMLFDAKGVSTPQWQAAERLLQEYESDLDTTAEMCAILKKLDLFSPFTFQIMQNDVPGLKLQGMHRIDEDKLKALKATNHKALVTKGLMGKIYAHFHSLENFARLYTRALAQAQARAAAKPTRR
jgi:SapC